jgi:hypothetical protein
MRVITRFCSLLPVFVLLFLIGQNVSAEVSSFNFVTDPQTVDVGVISGAITVQSQNSTGTSESIPETYDLTFNSTSGTGLFLNSSGNAVSTTMSKNTANRTFYYKDSASGNFVLTVKATARAGGQSFTATQHIQVGSAGTNTSNSTNTTATSTTSNQTETQSSSSTSSAHSSPVPLSTVDQKMEFEISAGRDRLTTVGNSVAFKAVATKVQNVSEAGITYDWSFGDGTTARGVSATHAYRFAGDYSVVVNASYSDKQAVSRVNVKVILPNIALARVLGGFEVYNKSNSEINLEGWRLQNSKKAFVFPNDTLIPANKKVVFADEVTGMNETSVELQNPMQKSVASFTFDTSPAVTVAIPETNLVQIQAKIDEVKATLAKISKTSPMSDVGETSRQLVSVSSISTSTDNSSGSSNTAIVFEATRRPSVLSAVFSWPAKSFNFVKHIFVEE